MEILIPILAGLLIALARGGKIEALGNLRIRYLPLFFVPVILQLIIFAPLTVFFDTTTELTRIIYLLSMALAALALVLNRQWPGAIWIAAGLALNVLVVTANGGFMPVAAWAREVAGLPPLTGRLNNVIPMTAETRLWFLGDILPLPAWVPGTNVFSLGDVCVVVGVIWFFQKALVPSAPPTRVAAR